MKAQLIIIIAFCFAAASCKKNGTEIVQPQMQQPTMAIDTNFDLIGIWGVDSVTDFEMYFQQNKSVLFHFDTSVINKFYSTPISQLNYNKFKGYNGPVTFIKDSVIVDLPFPAPGYDHYSGSRWYQISKDSGSITLSDSSLLLGGHLYYWTIDKRKLSYKIRRTSFRSIQLDIEPYLLWTEWEGCNSGSYSLRGYHLTIHLTRIK